MSSEDVKSVEEKAPWAESHVVEAQSDDHGPHTSLHRGLTSRHISIMTFSGVIGTGLFLTTGNALVNAGPLGLLLGYMIWSFFVWVVSLCCGEMATWLPIRGSFITWANRFISPNVACAVSWNYWLTTTMTICAEISAVNSCFSIWTDVNPAVWTSIMLVSYFLFNTLHVKGYGEVEFWYSICKLLLVFILILMSFFFMIGVNPHHETFGFRYWNNPGPMNTYVDSGNTGRFLGLWSVFSSAAFSLGGPDYIAITSAETINPRRNVPKVVRRVIYRLFFLYWTTLIGMGVMVPSNSPELLDALANGKGMLQSPFVVGFTSFGLGYWFVHLSNTLLILSAASCGNVFAYCAIRSLHTMALDGFAPKIFSRTLKNGAPVYAVTLTLLIACLSYLGSSSSGAVAFGWFTGLVAVGLLLNKAWMIVSWIFFNRALKAQGIDRSTLPFQGPKYIMKYGAPASLAMLVIVGLTFRFQVFTTGRWDVKNFITAYFMWVWTALIYLLARFVFVRAPSNPPETVDLFTGKAEVDADEAYWKEHYVPPRTSGEKFYEWIF